MVNRFYTQEFFELIKKHLKKNGILCLSLPGSLSYLSDEQADLNKCIFKTLSTKFSQIEGIAGYYNIYLASQSENFTLTPARIKEGLTKNNIPSALFTKGYIQHRLSPEYKNWFYERLKEREVRLNKDLEPVGVFYSIGLWNALFTPAFQKTFKLAAKLDLKTSAGIIFLSLPVFLCLVWFKRKSTKSIIPNIISPLLVLGTGFSGVSLNLILLLSLQTFYGYVYSHIGLLLSGFMVGLTMGSLLMSKKLKRIDNAIALLVKIDSGFVIFCLIFPLILLGLQFLVRQNVFFFLMLIILVKISVFIGFIVGLEFPLTNKIYLERKHRGKVPANILYAVDMLGAFFGAILITVLLIPVLGIINTVIFIFLVKLSIFILLATSFVCWGRKHP